MLMQLQKVLNKKIFIPSVNEKFLLIASHIIDGICKIFRISHPFSPVRIKKLNKSNNILPSYLSTNNYEYQFTLEEALIDWKNECPEEWD